MHVTRSEPPLKNVGARDDKLAELSLQESDQPAGVRKPINVRRCHDDKADAGREGRGYLEMGTSKILGHTCDPIGSEQDAVIAAPLAETVNKVRNLLTPAWIAPVLALDQQEMRKKVKPLRMASVPQCNVDFLSVESI